MRDAHPTPDDPTTLDESRPPEQDARAQTGPAALPPDQIEAYLDQRPGRRSCAHSREDVRRYHRERFATRGHEALTPGADLAVALLPTVAHDGRRWRFTPGAFATTTAEVLYSPSYSPMEKYVWTYLLDHRRYDRFVQSGEVVVDSVRLADLAACAGVSVSTASRALSALEAKRRLTIQCRGQGLPNLYVLATAESGASVYPTGHARSARRRVQALVRRALDQPHGADAALLAHALGFALHGYDADSLAELLWRRLACAVEAFAPPEPRPHAVDSAPSVSPPVQDQTPTADGSLLFTEVPDSLR